MSITSGCACRVWPRCPPVSPGGPERQHPILSRLHGRRSKYMTDQPDTVHSQTGKHAIVIGGSMAGLLAARVLSDHFDQVTILDRDRFPEGPEVRKGV